MIFLKLFAVILCIITIGFDIVLSFMGHRDAVKLDTAILIGVFVLLLDKFITAIRKV